jgi:hypothetical protein
MALTRTTNSGGENPRAAGSLPVLKARQAFFEETLSPHADDLSSRAEVVGDLIV